MEICEFNFYFLRNNPAEVEVLVVIISIRPERLIALIALTTWRYNLQWGVEELEVKRGGNNAALLLGVRRPTGDFSLN